MAAWLYRRVLRTLERREDLVPDSGVRQAVAEHVSNDLMPHLVTYFEQGLPADAYPAAWRRAAADRLKGRPRPPVPSLTSCRFVGVSTQPGRGVESGSGLYEFDTADGAHVFLHDSECVRLEYAPGPAATFTAFFRFLPEWVPAQLADRPVVVLRFLGAHVLGWETDPDEAGTYGNPEALGGQVGDLDWDGHRLFTLDLLTVRVSLTADMVEVSARRAD